MDIEIRPATQADYPAIAAVQRQAVDVCLRPLYDEAAIDTWIEAIDASKFERVVSSGEELFIGVVDGTAVGFVSFHPEMCILAMWYVAPSSLGRGYGSALLKRAEAEMTKRGCKVGTTEASLFARPHFEARGWVAKAEVDKQAFGGEMRVTKMEKVLG